MIKKIITLLTLTTIFSLTAFAQQQTIRGNASYYAHRFHGRKTASGQIFNMHKNTCAHRTLPFGTKLEVINNSNGKKVIVTVNDRGPFHKNRIVDLSYNAAKEIGMLASGTANVTIVVLNNNQTK